MEIRRLNALNGLKSANQADRFTKFECKKAPFNPEEMMEMMTMTATPNGFMNGFIEDMQGTLIAQISGMNEDDIA